MDVTVFGQPTGQTAGVDSDSQLLVSASVRGVVPVSSPTPLEVRRATAGTVEQEEVTVTTSSTTLADAGAKLAFHCVNKHASHTIYVSIGEAATTSHIPVAAGASWSLPWSTDLDIRAISPDGNSPVACANFKR